MQGIVIFPTRPEAHTESTCCAAVKLGDYEAIDGRPDDAAIACSAEAAAAHANTCFCRVGLRGNLSSR